MRLMVSLPAEVQDIVIPYIQRNAYFSHPSILLCSMLHSDEDELRKQAVKTIRKCRQNPPKLPRMKCLEGIWKYEIPLL